MVGTTPETKAILDVKDLMGRMGDVLAGIREQDVTVLAGMRAEDVTPGIKLDEPIVEREEEVQVISSDSESDEAEAVDGAVTNAEAVEEAEPVEEAARRLLGQTKSEDLSQGDHVSFGI